ncbi:MAG: peptidylprolyl isomerase [Nanoarchaeota archaeon]|nr:peptidylprolyl isomerase [Nanoarchaeota archaeon]MBU4351840.1 peptidylprolyl isomerase [Nanoarchaeota archaeon]MBU4456615.1 peptidylprolyl isomerase [Nanoarchaeota archaeon]MCG2719796.1 peptidylprolyl isomerase [Nanoarchaeota archaeon]
MAIKNGDFIEIEYSGKIKATGKVFDTNISKEAKDANIFNEKANYGPIIICVGEEDVLQGLDEALVGKEEGKKFSVDIPAEKGFGKKNPKLVKMMALDKFHKENIRPVPGLQLDFGNMVGTIVTVNGGRVMVDFNHPLANRELTYDVKINKIVKEDKEKLQGFLEFYLSTKDLEVELKEGKAEIKTKKELPEEIKKVITEKVNKRIPNIKEVNFSTTAKKEEKK